MQSTDRDDAGPPPESSAEVVDLSTGASTRDATPSIEEGDAPGAGSADSPLTSDQTPGATGADSVADRAPSDFELETQEQAERAGEALAGIEGLQPDAWSGLDRDERLGALQEAENSLAEVQGRESLTVRAEEMPEGYAGYLDSGSDPHEIVVGSSQLDAESGSEDALRTVAHEGRHEFQALAVDDSIDVTDREAVDGWRENLEPGNYLHPQEVGYEQYAAQPVEADAFDYEDRVVAAWQERSEQ